MVRNVEEKTLKSCDTKKSWGFFEGVMDGINRRGFNRVPAIFMIVYHICLAVGLVFYFKSYTPSFTLIMASLLLLLLTGISVTGGYHRYWAHTTYKTNPVIESILLFFASMAAQGSALRWSFDHRLHHAHVDTDDDPYSINKGFWYAHFLWIFEKPRVIEQKIVADLLRNKLVMFQHKYYKFCMLISNLLAFLVVGFLCNDFLGAFVISWWTRLFVLHHCTWFINSLAHKWGSQSFSREQTAVDNYIISFLTFGEGYHNFHHTFANDYRNGVRWYHFDPTKWMIWTLSKLGLAHGLRRMSKFHIRERMILAQRDEVIAGIQQSNVPQKEVLLAEANALWQAVVDKLRLNRELRDRYKNARAKEEGVTNLQAEMRVVAQSLQDDWKKFRVFSKKWQPRKVSH